MSPTRRKPLRGGPRMQVTAGQAEGGQPPEQPQGKRLTTSAMIASLAADLAARHWSRGASAS